MDRFPLIGDRVKILNESGLEEFEYKFGDVISRDGEYIYIQLHNTDVIVERYLSEIELIYSVS